MTKAITEDVKDILNAASISGGTWPLFIGSEPADPNNCITLYDTPGESPNPKWLLDFPRFMVRLRSTDYVAGFNKIEEVKEALLGLPSQTIGDIRYVGVWVVLDTHFLLADSRGRSIFINTYRSIREPATGTYRLPL
jgi:hypothetical protein